MRFRYRTPLALISLTLTAPAMANNALPTFEAVTQALAHGASVNAVVDLRGCTPAAGTKQAATSTGGLRINSYRVVADGTLSFADDHFTVYPDGTPVIQYLRYRVTPDQQVAFTMNVFSLPSYAKKTPEIGYTCRVGQDISFYTDTAP